MAAIAIELKQDEYAGILPSQLSPDVLRRLSVLNPSITISHIAVEWTLILLSIGLCAHFWHPALYLLAVIWIGSRQHALGVLMHEGSHYRIFKNKLINDWVSDIFLAWPILITTASYRSNHWQHHRHTNTDQDPDCHRKLFEMPRADWEFPITWSRLLLSFLKDITAVSSFYIIRSLFLLSKREVKTKNASGPSVPAWARASFYLALLAFSIIFGFWKEMLLFWFIPYFTVFNLILHVRSIAEHFATENEHPLNITRTTIATGWERIFFPKNINYHIEHHLYPSVPFYRLEALHRVLMEQPAFQKNSHRTQSYFRVLLECVRLNGFKKTCLREPPHLSR